VNELQTTEYAMTEIAAATTDCIIHWPGPWAEDTPAWLKDAIIIERIVAVREAIAGKPLIATEAEVVFYMMPRTFEAPLSRDWSQIYLYCSTRVMARHKETPISEDIKVKELTGDQQRLLDHLRRWLMERRIRYRKEKKREEKLDGKKKKDTEVTLPKQQNLFDFSGKIPVTK